MVDPKSTTMSTTSLEMMMRDSACFVAVVTRRDDQRRYRCSPFAVYEYGLAVQDYTPRLVFLEAGVAARHFDPEDCAPVFNRSRLSSYRLPDSQVAKLALQGSASADEADRPRGDVGLVLPQTPEYDRASTMIDKLLDDAGYSTVVPDLDQIDAAQAARFFDACDFIARLSHLAGRWRSDTGSCSGPRGVTRAFRARAGPGARRSYAPTTRK